MEKKEVLKKYLPDIKFALTIFVVFFAVYSALPICGIISSIPFLIIIGALAGYFFSRIWLTTLFGTLFALILSFATIEEGKEKLFFTAAVFAILLLSQIVAVIFKKSKKRGAYLALSFLALALDVFLCLGVFGTPFTNIEHQKKAEEYLADTYPMEEFKNIKTYRSISKNSYITTFEFFDTLKTEKGTLLHSTMEDDYAQKAIAVLSEHREVAITTALRDDMPNAGFTVRGGENDINAIVESGRLTLNGSDNIDDMLSFDISIMDACPSKHSFREYIVKYFGIIEKAGIVFDKITFYGGEREIFTFYAETEYGMDEEGVRASVKDIK